MIRKLAIRMIANKQTRQTGRPLTLKEAKEVINRVKGKRNGWIAGGHAPTEKRSKELTQAVNKYLKAIHKRDGTNPRR